MSSEIINILQVYSISIIYFIKWNCNYISIVDYIQLWFIIYYYDQLNIKPLTNFKTISYYCILTLSISDYHIFAYRKILNNRFKNEIFQLCISSRLSNMEKKWEQVIKFHARIRWPYNFKTEVNTVYNYSVKVKMIALRCIWIKEIFIIINIIIK